MKSQKNAEITRIEQILGIYGEQYFYDYQPEILVAYRSGLLPSLLGRIDNVYQKHKAIPPHLIEIILSVAFIASGAKQSYEYHTRRLLDMGLPIKDIWEIAQHLSLPQGCPDRSKWERVLMATYFLFRQDIRLLKKVTIVKELLSGSEFDHYLEVMSLARISHIFLEFITKYSKLSSDMDSYSVPLKDLCDQKSNDEECQLITICSYCEQIKSSPEVWIPIEEVIKSGAISMPHDFTHSICPGCFEEQLRVLRRI